MDMWAVYIWLVVGVAWLVGAVYVGLFMKPAGAEKPKVPDCLPEDFK